MGWLKANIVCNVLVFVFTSAVRGDRASVSNGAPLLPGGIDTVMNDESRAPSPLAATVKRFLAEGDPAGLAEHLRAEYPQDSLVALLASEHCPTVRAAVLGLGLVGDMDAVEPLVDALRASDPTVRRMAEAALWQVWFRSGDPEVDVQFRNAVERTRDRAYAEAIALLDGVVVRAPTFAEGYNQRAIAYFLLGEWDRSIADCLRTIEHNPSHFGALGGMGQCYMRKGELVHALDAFRRALAVNPNLDGLRQNVRHITEALERRSGLPESLGE